MFCAVIAFFLSQKKININFYVFPLLTLLHRLQHLQIHGSLIKRTTMSTLLNVRWTQIVKPPCHSSRNFITQFITMLYIGLSPPHQTATKRAVRPITEPTCLLATCASIPYPRNKICGAVLVSRCWYYTLPLCSPAATMPTKPARRASSTCRAVANDAM